MKRELKCRQAFRIRSLRMVAALAALASTAVGGPGLADDLLLDGQTAKEPHWERHFSVSDIPVSGESGSTQSYTVTCSTNTPTNEDFWQCNIFGFAKHIHETSSYMPLRTLRTKLLKGLEIADSNCFKISLVGRSFNVVGDQLIVTNHSEGEGYLEACAIDQLTDYKPPSFPWVDPYHSVIPDMYIEYGSAREGLIGRSYVREEDWRQIP